MQVIRVFENIALHGPRDGNIINQASRRSPSISTSTSRCDEPGASRNPHLRWITYSQSPTPPACGQTGTPNLEGPKNEN